MIESHQQVLHTQASLLQKTLYPQWAYSQCSVRQKIKLSLRVVVNECEKNQSSLRNNLADKFYLISFNIFDY
jgi:hypothetical protein